MPLRYFQAFILSSDYSSSSSHFQRCSISLLLFSSAVIAVSSSPIYLLLLSAETTLWNHTVNKNPFSPGRPDSSDRTADHQSRTTVPGGGRGGGFALYHWLPVPSMYLFLMKGSSSCRRAWDSAWWGRGLGPCSHCPHMLSACVAGVAEISLVLEHHSIHS